MNFTIVRWICNNYHTISFRITLMITEFNYLKSKLVVVPNLWIALIKMFIFSKLFVWRLWRRIVRMERTRKRTGIHRKTSSRDWLKKNQHFRAALSGFNQEPVFFSACVFFHYIKCTLVDFFCSHFAEKMLMWKKPGVSVKAALVWKFQTTHKIFLSAEGGVGSFMKIRMQKKLLQGPIDGRESGLEQG